jgi:hypothetical protein
VVFPDDAMTVGALIAELDRTGPVDLVSPSPAPHPAS